MVLKGVATVRAVGQGIAFLADSRSQHKGHPGWCQSPGALPPVADHPPTSLPQYLLIRGASTKGIGLRKATVGEEQWFPLFFKYFTQRYDYFWSYL